MWGRIVFGTDGSPAAARAGETAATIARAVSSKLVAVTGSASADGAEGILSGALEAAEAAGMRSSKISAEAVAGRAGDALVAAADDMDAGLIAIARGDGQPLSELGRCSQQRLAEEMELSGTMIVQVVDALERTGLVERRRNPKDRRANALHLTRKGREAQRAAMAARAETMAELTSPFGEGEESELRALLRALLEAPQAS